MRWYINDSSLQGQFENLAAFKELIVQLLSIRSRHVGLRASLYVTRDFSGRAVALGKNVRQVAYEMDRDWRGSVLSWLDKMGPFLEDERSHELDDYFECFGVDVTNSGLGEAARRRRAWEDASTFSFPNGNIRFEVDPLIVQHGLPEAPLGTYEIGNVWEVAALEAAVIEAAPLPDSWVELFQVARDRYSKLLIDDGLASNPMLAREPFDAAIRNRTLKLLELLDKYMHGRNADGSEGVGAREVIDNFFTGDRALFSGESSSNQIDFKKELTFSDPDDSGKNIFAHWHGKISHRHFRLHFEWPVPAGCEKLKVLYLGPKITKG